MHIRRIVVGLDGSQHSRRAAEWAASLASSIDAEVVGVHALGLLYQTPAGALEPSDTHRNEIASELESSWCAPFREGEVQFRAELREGTPVTSLLELAEEVDADLLVVGSRGVGGFPGLLLGSTSTQVAQHARRPVVIVPEPSP